MPNAIHSQQALLSANDIAVALLSGFGHLKIPFTFATADAAVLYTIPSSVSRVVIASIWWEVATSFTGGTASAIGVSSTNTSYNTKGDLLGGASGDVAATLVSTGVVHKGGTLGAKYGSNGKVVLVAGDSLRFDRITSAFTAGVGYVHADLRFID